MTHALSILSLAISLASSAIGSAEQRREELMAALKSGGYTILLRHARTDRTFNEQRDPVPTERSQQRNLNDAGIQDAKLMGVVFRKYAIPLGEIISSPDVPHAGDSRDGGRKADGGHDAAPRLSYDIGAGRPCCETAAAGHEPAARHSPLRDRDPRARHHAR